jgi:hypothetical protein
MKTALAILTANLLVNLSLVGADFKVTFLSSSSVTYPSGFFFDPLPGPSETADPTGPFDGKSCAFLGHLNGGSGEHIGEEYLIYRMQVDFSRDVYFDSFDEIAIGAQSSTSLLRILNTNMVVLRQIQLSEAVNLVVTNRIHAGLVGRSFIIDSFDQATAYRWRGHFGVSYAEMLPLTVPIIVSHPLNRHVLAGASAQFEVAALGPAPLDYRWQLNGADLTDNDTISGSGTSTLQVRDVGPDDAGAYTVVVRNVHGSEISDPAMLSVLLLPPEITTEPAHQTVVSGSSAGYTVAAVGSLPLAFQWQRNGEDLRDDARITGSQTPSMVIDAVGLDDLGIYTVKIRNDYGSVTSRPAALTVLFQPPEISSHPEDEDVFSGAEATFRVTAVGSRPLFYQWYLDGTPLADGVHISGARSDTLTIADAQPADLGFYWVEVRNAYGEASSFLSRLQVILAPPHIESEPQPRRVALGSTITLQVAATGSLPLSYQWERDGDAVSDGDHLSGSSTSTLTFSQLSSAHLGDYTVVIENPIGRVQSKPVSVATYSIVLNIHKDGDQVAVSWNDAGKGMRLQMTASLANSAWQDVNGSEADPTVSFPIRSTESAFFRLVADSTLPPPGMVAWWGGDGDARDIIGGHHGALRNGASFASGMVGEGFSFDGVDDVVELPYIDGLSSAMTVDAWIAPTEQGFERIVFGQSYGAPQLKIEWAAQPSFGAHNLSWNWINTVSASGVPLGEFSHIAGVFDGTYLKVYTNGRLAAYRAFNSSWASSTCVMWIGGFGDSQDSATCRGSGPQQHFKGVIDEVHVFNRALADAEVKSIYDAGRGGLTRPSR